MGTISFGRFEVDLESRVIRKAGMAVRLAPQPFTILGALVEAGGAIVTREELRRLLWPDGTFLEYEQAINVSIRRLREALGESASNPVYIGTIPGIGYRWLTSVSIAAQFGEAAEVTSPRLGLGDAAIEQIGESPAQPRPEANLTSTTVNSAGPAPLQLHWRWIGALAVLATVATLLGIRFLRHPNPLPVQARSSSGFSRLPMDLASPYSKCLSFAGRWRTTPDLSDMQINQSGCSLSGSFGSAEGTIQHTFVGVSSAEDAEIVVERTDFRKCVTELDVTLYLVHEGDLIYVVSGTSGGCGLRENYRETRVWRPAGL